MYHGHYDIRYLLLIPSEFLALFYIIGVKDTVFEIVTTRQPAIKNSILVQCPLSLFRRPSVESVIKFFVCPCRRPYYKEDNCCQCYVAALKLITGLKQEDILCLSMTNNLFEVGIE
jgi:hypothetical protein